MLATDEKRKMARQLQQQIDAMQGLGKSLGKPMRSGIASFESAFPDAVFPTGTIHEFVSYEDAHSASTSGFIAALSSTFIDTDGYSLWIGRNRRIFPSALAQYGLHPDKVIFIDLHNQKDLLWTIEEALKCEALKSVIGEIRELGFSESRRLQLAVERSGATGFIHRNAPKSENNTATTARWKIRPIASLSPNGLPGIGFAAWNVELLKVRNGKPGQWQVGWNGKTFFPVEKLSDTQIYDQRNAG